MAVPTFALIVGHHQLVFLCSKIMGRSQRSNGGTSSMDAASCVTGVVQTHQCGFKPIRRTIAANSVCTSVFNITPAILHRMHAQYADLRYLGATCCISYFRPTCCTTVVSLATAVQQLIGNDFYNERTSHIELHFAALNSRFPCRVQPSLLDDSVDRATSGLERIPPRHY